MTGFDESKVRISFHPPGEPAIEVRGFGPDMFFALDPAIGSRDQVVAPGFVRLRLQVEPPKFGAAASIFHPHRAGEYLRDGEPRPGGFSRNGRRRSLLGRRFGPPTDEGAWARRLSEIRAEREASQSSSAHAAHLAEVDRHYWPSGQRR